MDIKKHKVSDFLQFISTTDGILYFKGMGFISKEAASDIREAYLSTWKSKIDDFYGEPFVIIADIRDARVPSEEAKDFLLESMTYALAHGLIGSIEIVSGALIKMAVKRMMESAGADKKMEFRYQVTTEEEAFEKARKLLIPS